MFTGIVTAVGTVRAATRGPDGLTLRIGAPYRAVRKGESIAVDGACLTVERAGKGWFSVHVVATSLERTLFGEYAQGRRVNLERALKVGDRLGGHLVQGHVDAVAEVLEPVPDLRVAIPDGLQRYLIEKGSVTVDGVSLTVASLDDTSFTVAVIPHTAEVTNLGRRGVGERVNLEVDVVAKYVESMLGGTPDQQHATDRSDDE